MLRITKAVREGRDVIVLEGRLVGRWVDELERTCRGSSPPPVLVLSGVTFADPNGVAVLRRIRTQGAELERTSTFLAELLRAAE